MKRFQIHKLKCDVFVAGGGMSGVCCALAAARRGVSVILCQDRPVLGGNASSEIRMHIVGANTNRRAEDLENEARESGLIEEIRLENSVRNPQRSPSMFDQILYEKCRCQPNLTLLLNTSVVDVVVKDGLITRADALRASTEDRFEIKGTVFVDCTGDGGMGTAAGAAFTHGREAQDEFNEKLAQPVADKKTLGSTLLYAARKHDRPMPFTPPPWARKITAEDLTHRMWGTPGKEFTYEYGFWWLEWGGHLDTIKDNEAVRDELLAILFGVWDYVKNQGDFGADNWSLDWFGVVPGKRESRRFIGQHILTEADVLTSGVQPDAIAYGGWPIDIHPVHGFDQKDAFPCVWTPVPLLFDIPLRSCVARDIGNLMFAGRNISATHVAFASTRVMATCSVIGEGVGAAAAHAVKEKLRPSELASNPAAVKSIQQSILQEDGYLIGIDLEDSENVLRSARISASTELQNGQATNVLSGQNRALVGKESVADDRKRPGTHRWISNPEAGLPAWIQAEWSSPQKISEIEIVFDTALHRVLTFSLSDHTTSQMIWGRPAPETVRDFSLECRAGDTWTTLCEVSDNGQRRWRHPLPKPLSCDAIRITVNRTWGNAEARIIRVSAH
jgi:hypothetical protein